MATKESAGRIRSEPLDESAVASHQIGHDEFEFAWSTGAVRERTFGEFKRELLDHANMDVCGVYEAWWAANGWFPNRPLSQRLGMAEQALRELLAEGLVVLVADPRGESIIPRDQHDEYLRSWDTWVVTERGPKGFFWSTETGTELNKRAGRSLP